MLTPFPEDLFRLEEMRKKYIMFDQAFNFDGKFYYFPDGIMSGVVFYNVSLLLSVCRSRRESRAFPGSTSPTMPVCWECVQGGLASRAPPNSDRRQPPDPRAEQLRVRPFGTGRSAQRKTASGV